MIIRPETEADYPAIYNFVKTAFATAKVKDGTEQEFVNQLRAGRGYVPELALVMERDAEIIAHVMLTKTEVVNGNASFTGLLAAPLAVAIEYRDKGLGSQLLTTALNKAKDMGYKAVFLVGDRNYYRRFGFAPARQYGIYMDMELPEDLLDNVMALELEPGALKGVNGIISVHY